MVSVGEFFSGLFAFLGPWGSLLALFLIFAVDAMLIPTVPEVWFVITLSFAPPGTEPAVWSALVLLMAIGGEAVGNTVLYLVVRNALVRRGRMPAWIERPMRRWTSFLVLRDERLILLNRVAPVLPMVGAFVATLGWSYPRSLAYIVIGAAAKYGALLLLVRYLQITYDPGVAVYVTLALVIAVVGASVVASVLLRRRAAHRAAQPSTAAGRTRPPQSGGPRAP